MAIEFMKSFNEIVDGVHKVCEGVMDASEGLKQGRFKKKTGEELWNIFENTIGAGILGALEGALHVVESANEAMDVLDHKTRLLESGMSEDEYEKLAADETDSENLNAMPDFVQSIIKSPGGKKAGCGG